MTKFSILGDTDFSGIETYATSDACLSMFCIKLDEPTLSHQL